MLDFFRESRVGDGVGKRVGAVYCTGLAHGNISRQSIRLPHHKKSR